VTEAERDRSFNFGFAPTWTWRPGRTRTSARPVAAFETMKGPYEVARRERSVDGDVYFDCAVRTCPRLWGVAPAAAGAAG
jgi:hypothetical protein